ncbi:DUF1310 family protein [Streptococcus plurextorum]|uniref:DUF1310 family protein n=1 Tax=Streptococcus plurextorum TaxID=456876 RepID=UPI000487D344|nr:DUF1310 family protein [Streptococcus plurextorum]
MKTWQKWLLGITIAFVGIIGLGVTYQMNRQAQLKEEMIEIVESEEAKTLFEKKLKSWDPEALTESGKIKSYEIDSNTLNPNPMGGFSVKLYINGNKECYYNVGLEWSTPTGGLRISGGAKSSELQELIGR